jgi:hypothetical protein
MDGEDLCAGEFGGIRTVQGRLDRIRARFVGVTVGNQDQNIVSGAAVGSHQLSLADTHGILQVGTDGAVAARGRINGGEEIAVASSVVVAVGGGREPVGEAVHDERLCTAVGVVAESADTDARGGRGAGEVVQQSLRRCTLVGKAGRGHAARPIQHQDDICINPDRAERRRRTGCGGRWRRRIGRRRSRCARRRARRGTRWRARRGTRRRCR